MAAKATVPAFDSCRRYVKEKETDIQRAICDYLALKRYFFWPSNTTPIYDRTLGVFRAMPKYALKGVADILLLNNGRLYGIEVKTAAGRLAEARRIIEEWRIDYNNNRPHTSPNGLTPIEFAARPEQGQNWNRLSL